MPISSLIRHNQMPACVLTFLERPRTLNRDFYVSNMMINVLKRSKTLIETGNPINGTLCDELQCLISDDDSGNNY